MKKIAILSIVSCLFAGNASANWEYMNGYAGDASYMDNGGRFILSVRGGAALGSAGIKNDIGDLTTNYYVNSSGDIVSQLYYNTVCPAGTPAGSCPYTYAGYGNIGDLPVSKDFDSFGFAAGASIGFTVPNAPRWRIEAGWDSILESDYDAAPLFTGELPITPSSPVSSVIASSGGVSSSITTDIISVMAFYDFYDGMVKPRNTFIPYVGFGVGYADSTTEFVLSDLYGDLSIDFDLGNYGEADASGILKFKNSVNNSVNVAALGAFGFSYGFQENVFFDAGLRVMYIPKAQWSLVNEEEGRKRDWFSAENLIYTNIMLGIRFEF